MIKLARYSMQVKITTLITCLVALLFLIFFNASKHDPVLMKINVFIEDPYDAVGSFGFQLAIIAALISLVRIVRPYPNGISSENLSTILRGDAVSLLSIAVTLIADGVAIFRYLPEWTSSSAGWLLVFHLFGLTALTALAIWKIFKIGKSLNLLSGNNAWTKVITLCLVGMFILTFYPETWRMSIPGGIFTAIVGMVFLFNLTSAIARFLFPSPAMQPDHDFLDDLSALYQYLSTHLIFAGFLFQWIQKLVNISWVCVLINWFNPRRHPWKMIIITALGIGIALILAELI